MERVVLTDEEIHVLKNKGCKIGEDAQDIELEEGEIKQAKQYAERIRSHLPKNDEGYEQAYSTAIMSIEKYEGRAPHYLINYATFLKVMREIYNRISSKDYVNYDQCPIEKIEGYDFLIFDEGTIFYKSLTWFFDTTSQNSRMWVGDLRVVYQYLRSYQVGLMVYRAKEKTPAFIMSDSNLLALYSETNTPENIRDILRWMFGIDVDIERQVDWLKRPLWLNSRTVCDVDADVRRYAAGPKGVFRNFQHELFEYIEHRFNCVATYLRPTTGPFFYCNPAEVTIQPSAVEQLTQHPLSWTSYGYVGIEPYKSFIPKNVYNTKFRVLQWLEESCMEYENKCDGQQSNTVQRSDIICVDIQQFKPMFENVSTEQMIDSLVFYMKQWNPKILMCINVPQQYTKQLKNMLGYRYHIAAYNGAWDKSVELVIYYNEHLKYTIHKYKDRVYSNFIIAEFMGYKVAFVAALMAPTYSTDIGYNDAFKEKYIKNKDKYERFIKDILHSKPDIIIGQFPMLDIYGTTAAELEAADYVTLKKRTDLDHYQSHWIWHRPNADILQHIYPWVMSKIRPIGFKCVPQIITGGLADNCQPIVTIIFVVGAVIIIICHSAIILFGNIVGYAKRCAIHPDYSRAMINIHDRATCLN
jgi:hypothetical protein